MKIPGFKLGLSGSEVGAFCSRLQISSCFWVRERTGSRIDMLLETGGSHSEPS